MINMHVMHTVAKTCGRSGVDVLVWPFWLWPFWLWPFWTVAVMTGNRFIHGSSRIFLNDIHFFPSFSVVFKLIYIKM